MKKISVLSLFLVIVAIACFGACGEKKEKVYYNVTFVREGLPNEVKRVEKGSALTDVPEPEAKTGYTASWDRTDFTNVTSNITVNAVYTANTYKVTYDADGGTVERQMDEFVFDSEYFLPVPAKDGFAFVSWNNGNEAIAAQGIWKIAENVTLKAVWTDDLTEFCTVTFVRDGDTQITKYVKRGGTLTDIPELEAKTGYSASWDRTDFTNVTQDITVNAVYTANTYKVTYDADGGTVERQADEFVFDSEYSLPVPEKDGFAFVSWNKGSEAITAQGIWKIAENVTLKAVWTQDVPEFCTITFVREGYATIVKQVRYGGTLTDIPELEAKTGYSVSWDRTDFTNVSSDITVTAVETPLKYKITYDPAGGTMENTVCEVEFDSSFTLETPVKKGYLFKGWKIKGTSTFFGGGVWDRTKDIELTAIWEEDQSSDENYTGRY